jgi:RimJ/RimL family protein N-acetyltransferase
MADFRLETERLVLRSWREEDLDPFASMCADRAVMAMLGPLMSRDETAALIGRIDAIEQANGYTAWVIERRSDKRFVGWCGLIPGTFWPIDGRTEIGWRLAADYWGQGYVTEAARATVDWCFVNLPDPALWAITSTGNHRSRAVMERLKMSYRPELDFNHPKLAEGDPLRPHVTYALDRADWKSQ